MLVEFAIKPKNDERIQDVQADWNEWKNLHGDHLVEGATLLVVHTYRDYKDLDRWIEIDRSGGGVLFVTGGPAGELSNLQEQIAKRGKDVQELPHRWRVLKTPISGPNTSSELRRRIGRFLLRCAALGRGDAIPWDQLYSVAVSENVLSIYLWCLAQPTLALKGVTAPQELREIGDDAWRDLCTLNNERGLQIPSRSKMDSSLELDTEACELFTSWVKNVLLPDLA
jgi:hypothetical protein